MKRTYTRALAVDAEMNGIFFTVDKDGKPLKQVDLAKELISAFGLRTGYVTLDIKADDGKNNQFIFNLNVAEAIRLNQYPAYVTDEENRTIDILATNMRKPGYPVIARVLVDDEEVVTFYTDKGVCEDGIPEHSLIVLRNDSVQVQSPAPAAAPAAPAAAQQPPVNENKPAVPKPETPIPDEKKQQEEQQKPAEPKPEEPKKEEPAKQEEAPVSINPAPSTNEDIFASPAVYARYLQTQEFGSGLSCKDVIMKHHEEWKDRFTFDEIEAEY